jgi:MYXO-CTERM domain-containing protein
MARNPVTNTSRTAALAAVFFLLALAPTARANGAFPDEFSILFPAPATQRIYVGANFGLLVSEDDGATWRYACEPWVTEGSSAALSQDNVSIYQVTLDGAAIATSAQVTRSDDDACTWPVSGGVIVGQVVTDMFTDPNDATLVVAIVDVANGSYLVASHDGGQSFVDPPLYQTNALLTSIELSVSTPGVMYATSVPISGPGATLLRSTDSGATWTTIAIPVPTETEPLIMAIDPADSNTVYLRVVGALNDSIVITTDGGQTFETVLTISGEFSAFLRAGDGSLYAGTLAGELYVRAPGATDFTSHTAPHFRCLGQRPGTLRIYACGDQGLDGFDIGYSDDNGTTFNRMMNFADILGPLTCPPVATNCTAHWARIQQVLGIYDAGVEPPDGGGPGGPDAGTGGPDAGPSMGGKSGSCASVPGETGWGLVVLVLMLAWAVQRRDVRKNL